MKAKEDDLRKKRGARLHSFALCALSFLLFSSVTAETVEISVDLMFDNIDYVAGERIRAVVDVANSSPESVSVGYPSSKDMLFVEVFHSGSMVQLEKIGKGAFVSRFSLESNEGQKLATYLGDHYPLRTVGKYLAKPVLLHGGIRYEGQLRAFSVVPGMKVGSALQMFKNVEGLRREFELLSWSRKNTEHLFLAAHDEGPVSRKWTTTDLGPLMRFRKPSLSVLPTGEVIVIHCWDRDRFRRSEFWSLPDALELNKGEFVRDPETAGSERVKELYKESGGVKPVARPWWKFW